MNLPFRAYLNIAPAQDFYRISYNSESMSLKVGQPAPEPRVYRCSSCGRLTALLKDEEASICPTDEGVKSYTWLPTKYTLLLRTRNVAEEIKKRSNWVDKLSDGLSALTGNIWFVWIHAVWFTAWIVFNVTSQQPFDPFPFGLLTLVVSLEAIVLATFILMSQNRQVEVSDVRQELDFQVNLKSEKILEELRATINELHRNMIGKKRIKK